MTSKEKLLKKFDEEYNKLNAQQRQAVDRIEGPIPEYQAGNAAGC